MRRDSPKTERAVVLLSGGLDSTVSCAMAARFCTPRTALFFDYGQRAAEREERAVRGIASHFGLEAVRLELPWYKTFSHSAIIDRTGEIPEPGRAGLDEAALEGAGAVWVENRNAVFIDIAAAVAAARESSIIIVGFNREEAALFPDNGSEFLSRMNAALELGAGERVRVESPTIAMTKAEIVREALSMDIPWHLVWSCYRGGELMCGRCPSCLRLRRAIAGTPAADRIGFEGSGE